MNKIDPLFEAMSNIDDNIVSNAIREKRKRPIALMIAAAAAAVTLLTGYTVHTFKTGTRGVNVGDEHQFYHDIKLQNALTIPTKDELLQMGAVEKIDGAYEDGFYGFDFNDTLPSDVFKIFNAAPFTINNNFIEEPSRVSVSGWSNKTGNDLGFVVFRYMLTHKSSGITLEFKTNYIIDEVAIPNVYYEFKEDMFEIIELSNGSEAMVAEEHVGDNVYACADFSYNGTIYRISSLFSNMDMDEMKQVLADLGVL